MSMAKSALGLLIAIGGGVLGVFVVGIILHSSGPNASALSATVRGTAHTSQGTVKHAYLDLKTYPDSMGGEHGSDGGAHPDWVSYGPSTNIHLPAHSLVTVTIKQYDSGGTITNPYFARAHGTVGGKIIVNGTATTHINPDTVGHTFTIHGAPTNQDPLFVSVPLPALPDSAQPVKGSLYAKPNVVTFSFMTKGKGHYVFNCEYPCGDGYYATFGGPMSTRGYMSGTVTVG
jgi:hypothetical protein